MYKVMMEYAHHSHGEYDVLSENTSANEATHFGGIDWESEVEKSNELKKVSPTLSYKEIDGDRLIWVSGYGSSKDPRFVSESNYPGEVKYLFGLIKKQGIVRLSTDNFSNEEAKKAINLFVSGSYEQLKELYRNA